MSDKNYFVAGREVEQKLTESASGEVFGKEGRNFDFSGKPEGFGEYFRSLKGPGLGAGNDQVGIDLQLFQRNGHLTKTAATAAGQIALCVGIFRRRRYSLSMPGEVKFHDKE